jgi:hypothetical protein
MIFLNTIYTFGSWPAKSKIFIRAGTPHTVKAGPNGGALISIHHASDVISTDYHSLN